MPSASLSLKSPIVNLPRKDMSHGNADGGEITYLSRVNGIESVLQTLNALGGVASRACNAHIFNLFGEDDTEMVAEHLSG